MEIKINIKKCSECPHHRTSPYPTLDSFERPDYWWCEADDKILSDEEDENRRINLKKNYKLDKLRLISGYVEWNDKIPIPKWCPCKIDN